MLVGVFLLCAGMLFAQNSTGTISGRVVDPTGSAIAGAEVRCINQVDKTARTFNTTQTGDFTFTNLQPGTYTLSVKVEGFKKYDKTDLHLTASDTLQVLMKQVPDLAVDVRDVIADGDKVVVRAIWFGTDAVSRRKVGFHGFVQWRIVEGKFAERWATVTPLAEIPGGNKVW